MKASKALMIGGTIALLIASYGAVSTPKADGATPHHRRLIELKKETDAVVTITNTAYQTDVTTVVLEQLGLSPAEGWEICRVRPVNPDYYGGVSSMTIENRLYLSAWADMKEGESRLLDTELVQACDDTHITTPQRLSVIGRQPFAPVLNAYLTSGNRCRVEITNRDDVLYGSLVLSSYDAPFFKSRLVDPLSMKGVTLKHSVPHLLHVYQALTSYGYNDIYSYVDYDQYSLDTKSCTLTWEPPSVKG
jgi:hypothetical protein